MAKGKVVAFKPGGTPVDGVPKGGEMAEPVHRIAPEGAGSGLSVRDQPTSCVDQVRKICMHYVSKCSGKYGNSPVSARYVHQMATEILTQLKGVALQIKQQENNPEILQELLDEWNDQFPPSLGDLGTPKHIAATLQRQSKELAELKVKLSEEVKKREKDVSSVLRSMDAQLHASRDSVMTERRQHGLAHAHQLNQLKAQLKEAKRTHKHEVKGMAKASQADLLSQQGRFMDKIQGLERELNHVKEQCDVETALLRGKLAAAESNARDREATMKKTIKKLQLDIAHSGKSNVRSRASRAVEKRSVASADGGGGGSLGLGFGEDPLGDDGTATASGRSANQRTVSTRSSTPSTQEEEERNMDDDVSDASSVVSIPIVKTTKDTKGVSHVGPVVKAKNVRVRGSAATAGIKLLKRELKASMEESNKQEAELAQLRTDLSKYIADLQFQKRRGDSLESINESLRAALVDHSGHHEHHHPHAIHGSTITSVPQPLKHTPHFLGGYA